MLDIENSLLERLRRVDAVFPASDFTARGLSLEDIEAYYRESRLGYKFVHSQEGSIHMALTPNGDFNESGYLRAPELVFEKFGSRAQDVLELGCGNGFNLRVLAGRAPQVNFTGVDLVSEHVGRALDAVKHLPNATAREGNFERLPFPPNSMDAIYAIESLCHALDSNAALLEARRVARSRARLIVVDAWRTEKTLGLSGDTLRAVETVERAMSVGHSTVQSVWIQRATAAGWRLADRVPLSDEVMPNLERFERGGTVVMRHARVAQFLKLILPKRLLANAVAGYLMADSVRHGYHTYEMLTFEASNTPRRIRANTN